MTEKRMLIFDCPQCGQGIQTNASNAGKEAHCPYCRKTVLVPVESPAAQPSPPPHEIPQPKPLIPSNPPVATKKTSGMAVAGMVLGILSIVPGPMFGGGLWGLIGLTLSSIGLSKISSAPDKLEGKGLAIAGLVTSIVGLALAFLVFLMFSVFAAAAGGVISEIDKSMPK